jgi:BirA family biotin operon repressor/biotin-[acetyl-CoA-carboxylase] ligase
LSDRSASTPFFSRQERFARVASTNDVVRDWLAAGAAEVCVAVADEQTAGRGRDGRTWIAPPGGALLVSLGFRPAWIPAGQTWRLAALISLAMAEAAEDVASLPGGSIRLKWPNDIVAVDGGPTDARSGTLRKLAGVLGETDGLGTADPRVAIGLGLNAGWQRVAFPPELEAQMTSLHELSGGRPIDTLLLLETFLSRSEARVEALRSGSFDVANWTARQITTGRDVGIEMPSGERRTVRALGVDVDSGGLVVAAPDGDAGERLVHSGEIRHVRLSDDTLAIADDRLTRIGV